MHARDPTQLPRDPRAPLDDGAASHLCCMRMPALALPSTHGGEVRVDIAPPGLARVVIYAFPLTGLPGVEQPAGWNDIPGARGCTSESCGFRDHAVDLAAFGVAVAGLSTQTTQYQREAASRLHLPFALLSDHELRLATALGLPTFVGELDRQHDGGGRRTLFKRLTLVVRDGAIEKVFYPVFPPDQHAEEVLRWVQEAGALT